MKKMMIIAVLVSGMLMPAQLFAQRNHKENKRKPVTTRVENKKGGNRKEMHVQSVKQHHKPAARPVVVHHHTPAPPRPVVVHHHTPAPPRPVPVVHHHHCNSEAASVAAVAVGVLGLISLLAN